MNCVDIDTYYVREAYISLTNDFILKMWSNIKINYYQYRALQIFEANSLHIPRLSLFTRTGCVSKPILKRILDSLLDPIPSDQVEHLLRYSRWGEDGAVDYNDFMEKYRGK